MTEPFEPRKGLGFWNLHRFSEDKQLHFFFIRMYISLMHPIAIYQLSAIFMLYFFQYHVYIILFKIGSTSHFPIT